MVQRRFIIFTFFPFSPKRLYVYEDYSLRVIIDADLCLFSRFRRLVDASTELELVEWSSSSSSSVAAKHLININQKLAGPVQKAEMEIRESYPAFSAGGTRGESSFSYRGTEALGDVNYFLILSPAKARREEDPRDRPLFSVSSLGRAHSP